MKIKAHIKKHKVLYSCLATGIVATGVTILVMKNRCSDGVSIRPISFLANQTNNIVTVVEREGRGHPGYRILCLDTGMIFDSQAETAAFYDIAEAALSQHLNGKRDHAGGMKFCRLSDVKPL